MKLISTTVVLICLALPFASQAQSLGSVAKKERERRERNKKDGVAAREFSEEEVFGAEEPASEETAAEGELPSETGDAGEASPPIDRPDPIDENERFERESGERRRAEAEWRSRAAAARERIAAARERVQMLEGLFLGPDERYVDVNGNTVIESLEHLKQLVREANQELANAERALKDLQQEARRAGIPPGWMR